LQAGIVNWFLGIGANACLVLGSYWLARAAFGQPRGLPALLGTAVLFWTGCTLGLEVLGIFGHIMPAFLLAAGAVVLAAGGLARVLRGLRTAQATSQEAPSRLDFCALLCLSLVLAAGLFLGLRSLLLAVKVVSDGPIYHLYFAVRWWKAERLMLIAAPFGENAATYFPANGDLWFTWLMATWGGDRLARVGQAPFLALAGLAAYACARLLGRGPSASAIATCWFLSSTAFLIFSFEPNVDTIFVAGYMLAVFFFLRGVRQEGETPAIALGGLSAGLALGVKPVGLVFVPPLVAFALLQALRSTSPTRVKIARTIAIGALPLVTAGYWFARNLLVTGNPVYPLEVKLFSHTIWPGWYGPAAMRRSVYYIPITDWRALGDTLLAVLDPRLAPIWLAALCLGLTWPPRRVRNKEQDRAIALLSALAVLNILLYWLCIPYRTQQRFMLQALGVAVAPLAKLLDRSVWLRLLATALLALHLLTPQIWPFAAREDAIWWDLSRSIPNAVDAPLPFFSRLGAAFAVSPPGRSSTGLFTMVAIVAAALALTWAWSALGRRPGRLLGQGIVALTAAGTFILAGWFDFHLSGLDQKRFQFYPPFPDFYLGWVNFEARSSPRGTRVAYAGTNLPYYLLGNHLRNEVRYVNVDEHRDWLMHDYHREALRRGRGTWPNPRPGWDRARPNYDAWAENLAREGIQLLVVTRVNPAEGVHNVADEDGFPIERVWADSHPDRFEPLYGRAEHDPWFRLYGFRSNRTEHGAGGHIYRKRLERRSGT
jgi:hypothetical protein